MGQIIIHYLIIHTLIIKFHILSKYAGYFMLIIWPWPPWAIATSSFTTYRIHIILILLIPIQMVIFKQKVSNVDICLIEIKHVFRLSITNIIFAK